MKRRVVVIMTDKLYVELPESNDIKNPHEYKPHGHVQELVNGRWRDVVPHHIYFNRIKR